MLKEKEKKFDNWQPVANQFKKKKKGKNMQKKKKINNKNCV